MSSARRALFTAPNARVGGNLARMRFSIGATFAKCRGCEGEDFYPAYPWSPDRREVVICARCENQAILSELVGKPAARLRPGATAVTPAGRRVGKR